jgi:hypothetical protein
MSTLLLTFIIAFLIVGLALLSMAIGWILTGKQKISPGACGRAPNKKRDDEEGCSTKYSCQLCDKHEKKE